MPVGRRPIELDRNGVGWAMTLAPLVGLMIWLPAAGLLYGTRLLLGNPGTDLPAIVALATIALLTGGLHLDGLADLADGLGSRRPPSQALAIMRDSAVGALGVATLIIVILAQVTSLTLAVDRHHGTLALLTSQLAGRVSRQRARTDSGFG